MASDYHQYYSAPPRTQLPPFFCRSFRVSRSRRVAGHVGQVLDLWTVQHWGKGGGLRSVERRCRTRRSLVLSLHGLSGGPSPLLGSGRRHPRTGTSTRAQSRRSARHPALLGPAPFSLSFSSSSVSRFAWPPASSDSRLTFASKRDRKSGSTEISATPPRGSRVGARQKGHVMRRRWRCWPRSTGCASACYPRWPHLPCWPPPAGSCCPAWRARSACPWRLARCSSPVSARGAERGDSRFEGGTGHPEGSLWACQGNAGPPAEKWGSPSPLGSGSQPSRKRRAPPQVRVDYLRLGEC